MTGSKKNFIPLVLAVVLAIAAVFAVSKFIGQKTAEIAEPMMEVAVAAKDLRAGNLINEGSFVRKVIPASAAPVRVISWDQAARLVNQKMKNDVTDGDYIVLDDIGVGGGISDLVGNGEWAVSISLNGGAITSRLHPGDEIAIIGTFTVKETKKSPVGGAKTEETSRKITTVILPQVRILALDKDQQQGGDQFVLALKPEYAQMLVAAQEHGISLTPALRKANDTSALNRTTSGLVDEKTFTELVPGVERILIPATPTTTK